MKWQSCVVTAFMFVPIFHAQEPHYMAIHIDAEWNMPERIACSLQRVCLATCASFFGSYLESPLTMHSLDSASG